MKPAFHLTSLIAAAAISQLAACGQTGPLYLPAKPPAISKPAQTPTAPPIKPEPAAPDAAPATR